MRLKGGVDAPWRGHPAVRKRRILLDRWPVNHDPNVAFARIRAEPGIWNSHAVSRNTRGSRSDPVRHTRAGLVLTRGRSGEASNGSSAPIVATRSDGSLGSFCCQRATSPPRTPSHCPATARRRYQGRSDSRPRPAGSACHGQPGEGSLDSRPYGDRRQAVAASTRRRTRRGWSVANRWPIDPPVDTPATCTGPKNSWAMASAY